MAGETERKGKSIPCDSITKMTLDMGKLNVDVVCRALLAQGHAFTISADRKTVFWTENGYGHEYNVNTGKVTARGYGLDEAEEAAKFKQRYSSQIVREQAQRMGWQFKQVAPNKIQVIHH